MSVDSVATHDERTHDERPKVDESNEDNDLREALHNPIRGFFSSIW